MYTKLQWKIHAYHKFAKYPFFLDMQTAMIAIKQGSLLLPSRRRSVHKLTPAECVLIYNRQWQSISNTADHCLAVNRQPKLALARSFTSPDKFIKRISWQSILIHGEIPLRANYLLFSGNQMLKHVYFSIKQNKFILNRAPRKGLISIYDIYYRHVYLEPQMNQHGATVLKRQFNRALLNRLVTEIKDKWQTFAYPVKSCAGLTNYQQNQWADLLQKDGEIYD